MNIKYKYHNLEDFSYREEAQVSATARLYRVVV